MTNISYKSIFLSIIVLLFIIFFIFFLEVDYHFFSNDESIGSVTGGIYELRYDYDKDDSYEKKYFLYNWEKSKTEISNIEKYKISKNNKKIYIISRNNDGKKIYSILKYDFLKLEIYDELAEIDENDIEIFKNNAEFITLKE